MSPNIEHLRKNEELEHGRLLRDLKTKLFILRIIRIIWLTIIMSLMILGVLYLLGALA